jgi:hypothetical protein
MTSGRIAAAMAFLLAVLAGGGSPTRAAAADVRFTGKVTRLDFACAGDSGECRIRVDDVWVHWGLPGKVPGDYTKENGGQGKLLDAKGREMDSDALRRLRGKTVEVFARKEGKHVTLWGSPRYYLRVVVPPPT